MFNSTTDYSKDINKFLTKHEVIHYIQSKALGTPNDFLTAYETEYTYYTDTEEMPKDYAYYSISYEKGAYSFGPANSNAQSYYKEINKNKLTKGDEFCGSDKKN